MRLIDQLVKAVDMTATEKTIDVNGKEFTFWVTPLTAAERERALKEAGEGAAQSSKFGMSLIISKCRDKPVQLVLLLLTLPGCAASCLALCLISC